MRRDLILDYDAPANYWEAALPIGNGSMGAMIRGGVAVEQLDLNADTLWSGTAERPRYASRREAIARARELLREGSYPQADRLIKEQILAAESQSYLPAGTLLIASTDRETTEYRRELDLTTATVRTRYRSGGRLVEREMFASFPARTIVMRFRNPGSLTFSLQAPSPLPFQIKAAGNELTLDAQCPEHNRYGKLIQGERGIRYRISLRLLPDAGEIIVRDHALVTSENANEVIALLTLHSDFVDFNTPCAGNWEVPAARNRRILDAAELESYDTLLQTHVNDYQALFDRSRLTFPENAVSQLPTDQRLIRNRQEPDLNLIGLFYHYARYLMIAASRPGTQAMNLQGIWNDKVDAPWGCNYTTNINAQMNYWPVECANLSECVEPFLRMIRESSVTGREYAHDAYGLPGWCLHHNSDLWRFAAAARGDTRWGYFPLGGVWLAEHLFEHYQFTGNRNFLREIYPVLRGAAIFTLALLVDDGHGRLTTIPATSPENVFRDPATGKECAAACGSTMDWSLATEICGEVIAAIDILQLEDEQSLREQLRSTLHKLRRPGIGRHGEVLEYDCPFEEFEVNHRHLSHLYGVYPGNFITREINADLFAAAQITCDRRGDFSTGWAMGWRVALQARFGNGDRVNRILQNLFTLVEPTPPGAPRGNGGVYANLFDAHPPFQIDGNFGAAAAIVEALLQSHKINAAGCRVLEVLPALPTAWAAGGELTGVRARGNLTLNLAWQRGALTRLEISAAVPQTIELVTPTFRRTVELVPGVNRLV